MEELAALSTPTKHKLAKQYVLWVDGAGVYLLCLGEEVSIGGMRNDANRAEVCLMANLSRKHLTVIRSNGSYRLKTHESISLKNQDDPTTREAQIAIEDGAKWKMGEGVEIRFRQPTVLSSTAVLDFPGPHHPIIGQPPVTIDRVILMDQNCLIGAGEDRHVRLPVCREDAILYRSKNQLWCKSKTPISKNDQPQEHTSILESGDIITGRDFRFRLETVS